MHGVHRLLTLLVVLQYKGARDAVETLVGLGGDVTSTDSWRKTPLHLAAEMGQLEISRFLLSKWVEH